VETGSDGGAGVSGLGEEQVISYNTYVRPLPLKTRIKHWWRRVRGSK